MLQGANAVATLAVKDLAKFYEDTLGRTRADAEDNEAIILESGESRINVYRSRFAGTNQATALTWTVDDVEDVVRTLKAKGVRFEHYDLPEMKREGDVHVPGDMKAAWFNVASPAIPPALAVSEDTGRPASRTCSIEQSQGPSVPSSNRRNHHLFRDAIAPFVTAHVLVSMA